MTVEQRAQALLTLVARDCEVKRDALLGDAEASRAKLLAEAHARARARVRDAFREERKTAEERIAAARARLNTRRRIALQHREHALLEAAWRALPRTLRTRWDDASARVQWIDKVVADALTVLPRGPWVVTHPEHWASEEMARLRERLAPEGVTVAFRSAGDVVGLRIGAGGNTVDGTVEGLLAEREAIGAEVLYALESVAPGGVRP